MIVLSHRGYWKTPAEKNTRAAFERSFDLGFGTETDVRDCAGELVISHDMPSGGEMTLDEFLRILDRRNLPLAINIKSDGLAVRLAEAMSRHQVKDWFVFDMSVPDMRGHIAAGAAVFTRMSDVEPMPAYLDKSAGIWLDMFETQWYDGRTVRDFLDQGHQVCVVSSELHGRDHTKLWSSLHGVAGGARLMLCTDEPEAAQQYFASKGNQGRATTGQTVEEVSL